MKLVITKKIHDDKLDDNDDKHTKAMISITNIVCKWIKERIVYGVADDNNNTIELEELDIGEWVFSP